LTIPKRRWPRKINYVIDTVKWPFPLTWIYCPRCKLIGTSNDRIGMICSMGYGPRSMCDGTLTAFPNQDAIKTVHRLTGLTAAERYAMAYLKEVILK